MVTVKLTRSDTPRDKVGLELKSTSLGRDFSPLPYLIAYLITDSCKSGIHSCSGPQSFAIRS